MDAQWLTLMSECALSGSAAETANVGARAVSSSHMGGKMTALALPMALPMALSLHVLQGALFCQALVGGQTSYQPGVAERDVMWPDLRSTQGKLWGQH